MDMEQIHARYVKLISEEVDLPKKQFWLSFCDPGKPEGSQFLGVAIVSAHGIITATQEARRLSINPGGEVMCVEVPTNKQIPAAYCERLLTKEEAEAVPFTCLN